MGGLNKVVAPISPGEVIAAKKVSIPDAVIEGFNELIVKHWDGSDSTFRELEAVQLISGKGITSGDLYANHWLDIEDIYRKSGWTVVYDKPGYNESYAATFSFKKKKR